MPSILMLMATFTLLWTSQCIKESEFFKRCNILEVLTYDDVEVKHFLRLAFVSEDKITRFVIQPWKEVALLLIGSRQVVNLIVNLMFGQKGAKQLGWVHEDAVHVPPIGHVTS